MQPKAAAPRLVSGNARRAVGLGTPPATGKNKFVLSHLLLIKRSLTSDVLNSFVYSGFALHFAQWFLKAHL